MYFDVKPYNPIEKKELPINEKYIDLEFASEAFPLLFDFITDFVTNTIPEECRKNGPVIPKIYKDETNTELDPEFVHQLKRYASFVNMLRSNALYSFKLKENFEELPEIMLKDFLKKIGNSITYLYVPNIAKNKQYINDLELVNLCKKMFFNDSWAYLDGTVYNIDKTEDYDMKDLSDLHKESEAKLCEFVRSTLETIKTNIQKTA